jgi:DNA repair protein RecN (Recombination protein N)
MLSQLRVHDLVLIDELDIELSPNFNVLTGETGAGKSLVAVAVDLLLGRRASGELVRKGAREAEIEGLFDISDESEVKERLNQGGFPCEDELLIRRVIVAEGRHRCYVNGRLASLGVLAELADGLARVTSQHEQHSLMDPASQLQLLDGFGPHTEDVLKMERLYSSLEEASKKLDELKSKSRDRASRLDYLQFQLNEIDAISPVKGELEELENEIVRMRNQELLARTAVETAEELYEGDGAIFERLGALTRKLDEASRFDPELNTSLEGIREAAAVIEDAARFFMNYKRRLADDPERLAEMEDRLERLTTLQRKHGTDLDGVIALREQIAGEIESLQKYDETLEEANEIFSLRQKQAMEQAVLLTRKRKKTGLKLVKAVINELMDLMFNQAKFEVEFERAKNGIGSKGNDRVEFLVALNPGEGFHPLRKAASGGELSRLMLGVKGALAGVGPVGTYIFDEVDSGIGGQVAAAVGKKLKALATHHQVICITHMPQIAGMADRHLFVSKETKSGRTLTSVARLSSAERIEELARMLGGERITDKTRAAARELVV